MLDMLPVLIRSSIVALQLLCVPVGGRHFGSRPALEALKDTLRSFCAAPALMPKYAFLSPRASDINQTQTPPLRYVSSARARRAFVNNIVRYMAATISYAQ